MELTVKKPRPLYKCTQSELYAICSIGWHSYIEHLSGFSALKGYYNSAFAAAQLNAIRDAININSYSHRKALSKNERIILRQLKWECLIKWQSLKSYILSAYNKKEVQHIHLDSAGARNYLNARNDDWEVVSLMLLMGSQFMASHTAELTANNNMPAGFPAEYDDTRLRFDQQYEAFMNRRQLVREDCTEKIEANNRIYRALLRMFKDGVHIFRWNEAIRHRFIWKRVKRLISSEHTTSNNGQLIEDIKQ